MKTDMLTIYKWFDLDSVYDTIIKSLHAERWTDTDFQLLDVNTWDGEDASYITIIVAIVRYNEKGWPVEILGTVDVTRGQFDNSDLIYDYKNLPYYMHREKVKG